MLSKLRLTCRVTPSDRGPHIRHAWTDQYETSACERQYRLPPRDKRNKSVSLSSSSSSFSSPPSSCSSLPSSSSASALASESSSGWRSHPSSSSVSQLSRSSESSSSSSVVSSSSFSPESSLLCKSQAPALPKSPAILSLSSSIVTSLSFASRSFVSTELCHSSSASDCSSVSSPSCLSPDPSLSSTFPSSLSPDSSASFSLSSSSSSTSPSSSEGPDVLEGNFVATSAAFSVTTNTITTSSFAHSPYESSGELASSDSPRAVSWTSLDARSSPCGGTNQSFESSVHYGAAAPSSGKVTPQRFLQSCRGGSNPRRLYSVLVPAVGGDLTPNSPPCPPRSGALPSPSGDSDSDAQIDSMSSSDLEHCEDLQTFELAQNVVVDAQRSHAHDGVIPEAQLRVDGFDSDPGKLSLNGGESHMMSLREFEQLPPLPEELEELPAMWEDGGAFGGVVEGVERVGVGFIVGGEGALKDDGSRERWTVLSESSVRILPDGAANGGTGNSNNYRVSRDAKHDLSNLEQRSRLIEQTLSEIYESPFQHLMYANSQPSSQAQNAHSKARFKHVHQEDPPQQQQQQQHNPQDRVGNNGNEHEVSDVNCNENDDELTSAEADEVVEKEPGDADVDTQSTMKASIARAAQRAVSGYRTCDDADSYVGTRTKPTLILARAPPSPCGILRRTNRKAVAKVVHGSVRWADGRPPNLPPPDDAT